MRINLDIESINFTWLVRVNKDYPNPGCSFIRWVVIALNPVH